MFCIVVRLYLPLIRDMHCFYYVLASQDWEDDKSVLNWMTASSSTIEVRGLDVYAPFLYDPLHSLI